MWTSIDRRATPAVSANAAIRSMRPLSWVPSAQRARPSRAASASTSAGATQAVLIEDRHDDRGRASHEQDRQKRWRHRPDDRGDADAHGDRDDRDDEQEPRGGRKSGAEGRRNDVDVLPGRQHEEAEAETVEHGHGAG